jgi:glutamate synthase domain-containing protein 3
VLAVRPPTAATFAAEDNVIVGNTVLYGAVGGEAFFRGRAGERFAVRNSGANAVVEGLGDHGCEHMTGGRVVVLGSTGRNFAAGMSGGIAYVLDADGTFSTRCNTEFVELESLEESDVETIRSLVESHLRHTGSPVAGRVLAEWESHLPLFAKVMPRDYKRVLAASQNGHGAALDDHVTSSGGEGFLTTESETAQAAG